MFEGLVKTFVIIFGGLTLVTQLSVICGLTFNEYYPLAVAMTLAGVMFAPFLRIVSVQEKQLIQDVNLGTSSNSMNILIPILLVITLSWLITKEYILFWSLALVTLFFSLKHCNVNASQSGAITKKSDNGKSKALVLVVAVIAALITSTAHRPDTDDGFFISVASYALSHPNTELLSVDTMHSDPQAALPLLLPAYAVESLGLIEAVFAKLLGVAPIYVAHLLLPPLFAMLIIFAWVLLVNEFLPRRLVSTALVAFVFLILFGEHHQTIGNFGFVRLHQGKAVLASALVPLLYFYVIRFMKSGNFTDLTLVVFSVISGVGLSSSGVFVIPAVVLIGALSSWTSGRGKQLIILALPLGYIGIVALYLRAKVMENAVISSFTANSTSEIISAVYGTHTQYIVLFCLVGAWLFVPTKPARRSLYYLAVISLIGPMNPFIGGILAQYVTSPAVYWRILWCVPALLCCIIVFVFCFEYCFARDTKWRVSGMILFTILLAWLLPFNVLRSTNRVVLDFPRLKVIPNDYAVAMQINSMVPLEAAILSPEAVSIWIAAQPLHPFLPINRQIDILYMRQYLASDDYSLRSRLSNLVNGGVDIDAQSLVRTAIKKYSISLIVLFASLDRQLSQELQLQGFTRSVSHGYAIWLKPKTY